MPTQNTTNKTHDATTNGVSDALLTKTELANRLRISRRTLDNWQRLKRLPHFKIGKSCRYKWDHVLERLSQFRID
jgi:excisionase family DNA binding protein